MPYPATSSACFRACSTLPASPGQPGATGAYPVSRKRSTHGPHESACSQRPWMKTTGVASPGMVPGLYAFFFKSSRYSARRSQVSTAPSSMPDCSIPSRSSTLSNRAVLVSVVLPLCSSNVTVPSETCPGAPSHSNVHTMRSGRTISRNSPRNAGISPSGPRCTIRHRPPGRKSISQLAKSYFLGPHQFDMCSQEPWASKTRSRGASNTRVITISRSDGVVSVVLWLPVAAISLLLSSSLDPLQVLVQSVVALLPEAAVPLGPLGHLFERSRFEPSRAPLALPAPRDQPCPLQHLQVLRDGREAHLERLRQLLDRGHPSGQPRQDRSPGRIGERCKGGVQPLGCR